MSGGRGRCRLQTAKNAVFVACTELPKYVSVVSHCSLVIITVMDGTKRTDVKPGQQVAIVLKQDQRSGRLTRGIVKEILTKSATHPHGIKVRLDSGQVGRVKEILS